MAQLLNTLHSASKTELQLKINILEALKLCLKESHRTRTVFRKVRYINKITLKQRGPFGNRKEEDKEEVT